MNTKRASTSLSILKKNLALTIVSMAKKDALPALVHALVSAVGNLLPTTIFLDVIVKMTKWQESGNSSS
jgi:hypothetical protein